MKRCWFGAGLLLGLLILGFFSTRWPVRCQLELADLARQSWEEAREGDMEEAAERIRELETLWNRRRKWLSVLTDHGPLDEAGVLLEQLKVCRDRDFYLENCLRLENMLRDLARNQQLSLANLL